MFQKIAKLKRAQKAFKDGFFDEALGLAEDPEIREHLKAQRLRELCLDAITERAEKRAQDGDESGAVRELQDVAERADRDSANERARELEAAKKRRRDRQEKARARFYRARLELDRGDLAGAEEILGDIEPGLQSDDIRSLLEDIQDRRRDAQREIERAAELMSSEPAQAESHLTRAAGLDPRSPELRAALQALASEKIRRVGKTAPSDAALSSFLIEYGLFKRRLLNQLGASEQRELDEDLSRLVGRRVDRLLDEGRLAPAATLLERRRENLAPHQDLDSLEETVKGVLGIEGLILRAEFATAKTILEAATKRLGRTKGLKEAKARLLMIEKTVPVAWEESEEWLGKGEALKAKARALDALALAPESARALRLLRSANERLKKHRLRLGEARTLIDRRRVDDAADILAELKADGCHLEDVGLMEREIEILESVDDRRRSSRSPGARNLDSVAAKSGLAAVPSEKGRVFILSVEEHGEHLVHDGDRLIIGAASTSEADLPVLASLASRHALLERRSSFHDGQSYMISALDGQDLTVNGVRQEETPLVDGDEVALGRDFRFIFRRPNVRSGAARLDLQGAFTIRGCGSVLLMPVKGRAGALVLADTNEAHVRCVGHSGLMEIYRDREGILYAQGPSGVSLDGAEVISRVEFGDRSRVQSDEIVATTAPV